MLLGVKVGRSHPRSHGHADGVAHALAERAGGGLYARGFAVFGVAGGLAVELAEVADFLEREFVAREVEPTVQEHAAVASGEDHAVAVDPRRVGRVVAQGVAEETIREARKLHVRYDGTDSALIVEAATPAEVAAQ